MREGVARNPKPLSSLSQWKICPEVGSAIRSTSRFVSFMVLVPLLTQLLRYKEILSSRPARPEGHEWAVDAKRAGQVNSTGFGQPIARARRPNAPERYRL